MRISVCRGGPLQRGLQKPPRSAAVNRRTQLKWSMAAGSQSSRQQGTFRNNEGRLTLPGSALRTRTTTNARQSTIAAGSHRLRVVNDKWENAPGNSSPSGLSAARAGVPRHVSQMPQPSSSIGWSARWQQRQITAHREPAFLSGGLMISMPSSGAMSSKNCRIALLQ